MQINFDASFKDQEVAIAVLDRDEFVNIIGRGCKKLQLYSFEVTESRSLSLAIGIAKAMGVNSVMIERDCKLAINYIKQGSNQLSLEASFLD